MKRTITLYPMRLVDLAAYLTPDYFVKPEVPEYAVRYAAN
jgi:hypothetical protein